MVFSACQWYLGSYKQKGWNRKKDIAEKSTHTDLCTAFCRSKIHIFALGTAGNHWEPLGTGRKHRETKLTTDIHCHCFFLHLYFV